MRSKVWWLVVGVMALMVTGGCSGSVDNAEDMSGDSGTGSSTVEDGIDSENSVSTTGDSTDNAMMVVVPAGEFIRGKEESSLEFETPARAIYLDEFWIDIYEVTVDAYSECVRVGSCEPPKEGTGLCQDSTINWGKEEKGNHPMNCVTAFNADDFCEWAGKRLPTEAEWEKAARGTDGRTYPWGEEFPDCSRAVMYDGQPVFDEPPGCGRSGTWPVGSKPSGVSPYGAHDMAGNVWEWTADGFEDDYYSTSPSQNPPGSTSVVHRVIRGGSWYSIESELSAASRHYDGPNRWGYPNSERGFRCAKSPD